MATKASINQQKYDSTHTRLFRIKLNLKIDADIIEKLTAQPSMQGYIKQLIRDDIARTRIRTRTDSVPVSESDNDMEPLFQNMIRDEM